MTVGRITTTSDWAKEGGELQEGSTQVLEVYGPENVLNKE
jgi:hypothetical protein